jgi:hypothetical protein
MPYVRGLGSIANYLMVPGRKLIAEPVTTQRPRSGAIPNETVKIAGSSRRVPISKA